MERNNSNLTEFRRFLRQLLMLLMALCLWFIYDSRHQRNIWFLLAGAALLAGVLLIYLLPRLLPDGSALPKVRLPRQALQALAALGVVGLTAAFFIVRIGLFNYGSGRLLLMTAWIGLLVLLMALADGARSPYLDFALFFLAAGALYRAASFLPEIQPGPFALGWSEGSRFFNASLFDAQALYGQQLPLPVLHPSRYLLQALPFFVGVRSILAHRIWQVLLWLGMTALGAWLVSRRLGDRLPYPAIWVTLFAALFFFQGAVYYHLLVCVILVLVGYRPGKPWRTLGFVLLSAVWAGISRVNWIPVPGLLATALYLLDEPLQGQSWWKYVRVPLAWNLLGLGAAFASQQAYIALSGEDPALFNSAFSSALLWYRLLPNSTFFLGILPAVALVCLPTGLLSWHMLRTQPERRMHWLRWMGLGGILAAFFLGGLVVSVKIGGGGDLHNLDAFLVFWLVISLSLMAGCFAAEGTDLLPMQAVNMKPQWVALLVIVPVAFAFMRAGAWPQPDLARQQQELASLSSALEQLDDQPGDVLFISERQLLTFQNLTGIEVVPEYEKVFLMEMAMAGNQPYLEAFYDQLARHSYRAIICDSIAVALQDRSHGFGEENNAWVQQVVLPMLEEYELAGTFRGGEVNLLVPKN